MIIEISIACSAAAFVVLTVFLIVTLVKTMGLIKNANELTYDIKRKSHRLDPLFKPLNEKQDHSLAQGIIDCVTAAFVIYSKIKEAREDHGKPR